LIETIARLQGADLALNSDGLSLLWPRQQLDRHEAMPSICEPSEQSRETA
jgi:hypothetical protein